MGAVVATAPEAPLVVDAPSSGSVVEGEDEVAGCSDVEDAVALESSPSSPSSPTRLRTIAIPAATATTTATTATTSQRRGSGSPAGSRGGGEKSPVSSGAPGGVRPDMRRKATDVVVGRPFTPPVRCVTPGRPAGTTAARRHGAVRRLTGATMSP